MTRRALTVIVVVAILAWVGPVGATPFFFSSGNPDGLMATGSRPSSAGKIEIETGDDFVVGGGTQAHQRHLPGAAAGRLPAEQYLAGRGGDLPGVPQ